MGQVEFWMLRQGWHSPDIDRRGFMGTNFAGDESATSFILKGRARQLLLTRSIVQDEIVVAFYW
ncbi:MAG: hypothetical protein HC849_27485 [Oscillatoriales cyanobacterium RU_3_3]|nr:hypothetical protein [Microcoleus sp. SM1_3_4]NJM63079.1 hypothetical protein [Oscillatoriales cyanobacterium RU_3_3]